jgi:hypothetical protein
MDGNIDTTLSIFSAVSKGQQKLASVPSVRRNEENNFNLYQYIQHHLSIVYDPSKGWISFQLFLF